MADFHGAVAQLGERLVCNQEATGSIPVSSTRIVWRGHPLPASESAAAASNLMLGAKGLAPNIGLEKRSFWLLAISF
jgi:glycerate-2-kinase